MNGDNVVNSHYFDECRNYETINIKDAEEIHTYICKKAISEKEHSQLMEEFKTNKHFKITHDKFYKIENKIFAFKMME